ncbi:MAG TPA: DNA translocase FtsK [Peptococcaceae bacterium]|nr:DNA translocase FtsK [Peptococcaceae bacterium]
MSIIGFLGYFKLGTFPTNLFRVFQTILGSYTLALPFLCLVFTVVCWKLSSFNKEEDNSYEYEDIDGDEEDLFNQSAKNKLLRRDNNPPLRQMNPNGFSAYFAQKLTIKNEDFMPNKDKYKKLGTNFSTYFGQGNPSIYLPPKIISLQGFKDYFRNRSYNHNEPKQINLNHSHTSKEKITGKNLSATKQVKIESPNNQKEIDYKYKQIERLAREANGVQEQNWEKTNTWQLPSLELLTPLVKNDDSLEKQNPKLLEDILSTFGVTAKVVNITVGPVITRYELTPAPGTKISKIVNLADDIALALASKEIRIEAPIPGKAAIGIEIPRHHPRTVYFREVIDTEDFRKSKAKLKVALGKDIADSAVIGELEKMPHLLVAGATGSGKSIFINCLINSILFSRTPEEVKLLLIDPKMVELNQYNGIPHLLAPVVTDPKQAGKYLKYILKEMETRYELFATNGVRDIEHYNQITERRKLPYMVVIIDELADLMMVAAAEIEETICRLAQMARAAGIHLVIATQRPSVNVITGLIKANIPSRISFAVSSQIDSRTILDMSGAEKLLGKGDMLYSPLGLNKPIRVHGCFINEQDIKRVIAHWQKQGNAFYLISEEQLEELNTPTKTEDYDERFVEAAKLVITSGIASVSFLQRRLRIGYSRAARLMDMLQEAGVVGENEGNKPRKILMSLEAFSNKHCS